MKCLYECECCEPVIKKNGHCCTAVHWAALFFAFCLHLCFLCCATTNIRILFSKNCREKSKLNSMPRCRVLFLCAACSYYIVRCVLLSVAPRLSNLSVFTFIYLTHLFICIYYENINVLVWPYKYYFHMNRHDHWSISLLPLLVLTQILNDSIMHAESTATSVLTTKRKKSWVTLALKNRQKIL